MTSHRIRPVTLLLTLAPLAACYATHDPLIITGDSGSEEAGSESGSTAPTTTAGDPTTASDTSMSTTMSTSATDDTGPTDTGDSTADGSTTDTGPVCGDGMVEGDEVCDDGVNDGSYGGCVADCSDLGPHCGDGVEQGDEVCDDGDEVNGDGCNVDCIVSGSELWTRTFAGAADENDLVNAVAVGPDDYIVAVGSEGLSPGTRQAWIQRYASDGSEDWNEVYPGASGAYTEAFGVAIDDEGGVYVGGRYDGLTEDVNGWARKYDDSAALEYTHLFNGAVDGSDRVWGVAVSPDGYAVLAGVVDTNSGVDAWVRRLGQDGTEFWTRTQSGVTNGHAVAIDSDGSIVVVGTTDGGDVWVRKYDQDGGTAWTRTYDGGSTDNGIAVAIDDSGRIAVLGTTIAGVGIDIWVRQYDANGATLWSDTYDSTNDGGFIGDYATGIAVDAQANVIVSAGSPSDDSMSVLAWVRKYTEDGAQLWTQTWHVGVPVDAAYTYASAVAVDSSDNIIVGGVEALDSAVNDCWVRKLAP